MKQEEKVEISEALRVYCQRFESQNMAARSLKRISPATVSAIINAKFEEISDEMFLGLKWQIGLKTNEWNIQETTIFKEVTCLLSDAQENRNVTWIVGDAGCGKTTALHAYEKEHKEVYYILCSEDMKKFDFVREMAAKIGISSDRSSIREILDAVIAALAKQNRPLLIFDEGDKLNDTILAYFITIYNQLEDKVGIVFASTDYIEKRMSIGLCYNKRGYKEINSRIGRKFYKLTKAGAADAYAVCRANGIDSESEIGSIVKDVESCDFDFRRLKKVIHKTKRIREINGRKKNEHEKS